MREGLGADAANPPGPAAWVADLQHFGCAVAFVYVWGPYENYTPEHVAAARAAGITVIPIVVPGDTPPPPPLYAAALPYGISGGHLFYDVERFSMATPDWVRQGVAISTANGFQAGVYCTAANRAAYPFGLWWRAGTGWTGGGFSGALPAPPLDLGDFGGAVAVQYDFEVQGPSGARYDLSRVDLDQLAPGPPVGSVVPATLVPAWAEEEE